MSYAYYSDLVNNFSKINWIKTDSIIENIAAVKDADEIDALQTAVDITDEVLLGLQTAFEGNDGGP